MGYLLSGIIIFSASTGGLWVSLPGADGQINPLAKNGRDTWIAIAVTVGMGMGMGALVVGIAELIS